MLEVTTAIVPIDVQESVVTLKFLHIFIVW